MERTPLHQEIDSLPDLLAALVEVMVAEAETLLAQDTVQVIVTGCGDSHHAAVGAELAFNQLSGLPCRAATAMHCARYLAPALGASAAQTLVIGVSASGQVSRTIEALRLAGMAGAATLAVTGSPRSDLAAAADLLFKTTVPPLPDLPPGLFVPGARSYVASQLALYVLAIQLGRRRGHLDRKTAASLHRELGGAALMMEETIAACDPVAASAARQWADADTFTACGSGPAYASALFTAAKILEASGDTAVAQDLEEWAHLEYFAREAGTPTMLFSTGPRDSDRAQEVAAAAQAIGRRLALVAPAESPLAAAAGSDTLFFPLSGPLRPCFTPLTACLPGLLFAAYRAQLIGEPYFRAFGGGRSVVGGGGISRIRSSDQLDALPDSAL